MKTIINIDWTSADRKNKIYSVDKRKLKKLKRKYFMTEIKTDYMIDVFVVPVPQINKANRPQRDFIAIDGTTKLPDDILYVLSSYDRMREKVKISLRERKNKKYAIYNTIITSRFSLSKTGIHVSMFLKFNCKNDFVRYKLKNNVDFVNV